MCIVADADRRGLCAEMPAAGTGAPQRVQNFAPGLSACPQFGQVSMLYLPFGRGFSGFLGPGVFMTSRHSL